MTFSFTNENATLKYKKEVKTNTSLQNFIVTVYMCLLCKLWRTKTLFNTNYKK